MIIHCNNSQYKKSENTLSEYALELMNINDCQADIFIPVHEKDFITLPLCVKSIINFLVPKPNRVIIASKKIPDRIKERILKDGDVIILTGGALNTCLRKTFQEIVRPKLLNERRMIIFIPLEAAYPVETAYPDSEWMKGMGYANYLNKTLGTRSDFEMYNFAKNMVVHPYEDLPRVILVWIRSSEEY